MQLLSIFRDGDIYRMYYDAWAHEPSSIPVHEVLIAYAESKDGKNWVRPELGLFEFNGSKKNNIVWVDKGAALLEQAILVPSNARWTSLTMGAAKAFWGWVVGWGRTI